MTATEVLKKYWNYDAFRPGQEEVVNAIVDGRDTLALFPTGGGKSICFQVPGLMSDGITLVVSPLIALMKDQVEQLQKRDIPAIALHSGMGWKEMRLLMENVLKGRYKFLYISPERLATENFREYLPNLPISLLVVDEAHCISQWGYDFRPGYLRIAEARDWLPGVPVAAFTASAPPNVQADITDKLELRNPFVFTAPFRRDNLHYHVIHTENKSGMLLKALLKTNGPAIVFCDSRRETEEITRYLLQHEVQADFYHAGLDATQRSRRQDRWMRGQTRVMVCTNAFGMGVDKPDVRYVFHMGVPAFPEAYYQEAGRAGRDGQESWCMLFYKPRDSEELLERTQAAFPGEKTLERMYNAVCNYYGIPAGGGKDQIWPFEMQQIAARYQIPVAELYYAVANLETLGYWTLSDGFYSPSRLLICLEYSELYNFKLRQPRFENLIDILLRTYGGILENFVKINEKMLATRLRLDEFALKQLLKELQTMGVVEYEPATDQPRITFTEPRSPYPHFHSVRLEKLRQARHAALQHMDAYILEKKCRAVFWEKYYGAGQGKICGKCDLCMQRKKENLSASTLEKWSRDIEALLRNKAYTRAELLQKLDADGNEEVREILRWMMDHKKILVDANQRLYWKT